MALAYTIDRQPGQITVVVAGEADPTAADQLHAALFTVAVEPYPRMVVDLRGLVFIDSTSIGILLAARRAAAYHGGTLRIAHPHGQVLRVLQVAGVFDALTTTAPAALDDATAS